MRARPGCGRMKTEQRLSLLVGMSFDMRNPGRSELEWVVKLPAPCSLCGNENLECVARLLQKRDFVCSFCGRTMDLTLGRLEGHSHQGRGDAPAAPAGLQ